MTPKEKAKQLVWKYECSVYSGMLLPFAKQCALIAVDELIENVKSVDSRPPNYQTINEGTKEYWKQVKEEIYEL